jgi:hypothetical protein
MLLCWSNQWGGARGMYCSWGTQFWFESLKSRERPLGKPRRRWEDNIKVDLRGNKIWVCGLDSRDSGQGSTVCSWEDGSETCWTWQSSHESKCVTYISGCCTQLLASHLRFEYKVISAPTLWRRIGGTEVKLHSSILRLAIRAVWSSSRLDRLCPRGNGPVGGGGLRNPQRSYKEKHSCLFRESNPSCWSCSHSTYWLTCSSKITVSKRRVLWYQRVHLCRNLVCLL